MKPSRRRGLRLILATLLPLPPACLAGGFALIDHSARSLGTSYTDAIAGDDDAAVLFMNPAGLAGIEGTQATVSAIALRTSSRFSDQGSRAAFGQPLGATDVDPGQSAVLPALFAAFPLTRAVKGGLGLFVPFGLETKYPDDWAGRFFAQQSRIRSYSVNGSLAATVAPGLSVGAGIEYQKLEATLTNAVNYTAVIAQASQLVLGTPAIVPGAEGHVRLHGDDRGWAYVASAQWRITPRLLVGLSYRSGISYDVRGDASFDVPALPSPALAALAAAATPSGPVSVAIKTPDMRGIGGSYTLPNGARLFVQGVRTGWSSVQEQRVVRDNGQVLSLTPLAWKDAWRYGVGMAWPLASGTVLRAGIARDETPIPAETRNTRLPANTWTTAGLGARFLLRQDHERHEADRPGCIDCIDVALGYTWVQNAPVREGGETPPGSGVLPSGLVVGDYRGRSTLAGVQYTHRF